MSLKSARFMFDDLPNRSRAELMRELILVKRQLAECQQNAAAQAETIDSLHSTETAIVEQLEKATQLDKDFLKAWDKWTASNAPFNHGNFCGGSPCLCGRNELITRISEIRAALEVED